MASGAVVLLTAVLVWGSCAKQDDWKEYLPDQPKVYPGKATEIRFLPGRNRVMLRWLLVSDPTITRAKVYWNNGHDSAALDITRKQGVDTVSFIVDKLQEATYTFTIHTYDKEGNQSVPAYSTGPVLGQRYENTLLNRAMLNVSYLPDSRMLVVNWGKADTVNTGTKIWYTDLGGIDRVLQVDSGSYVSTFPWKVGSKIYYQSSYKPYSYAIDTFSAPIKDSVTVTNIPVAKNNWSVVKLPTDAAGDAWGTNLAWLWDGKAGDYPEIYHTNGNGLPHHFTIDLGGIYNLTQVETIGRNNDNPYHNVTKYQVWGVADLANAITTLPGNDPGWEAEARSKGWTLLKEVTHPTSGTAPYRVNLPADIPSVRYIRFRVLQTVDHSEDSHMSELTFWYNP